MLTAGTGKAETGNSAKGFLLIRGVFILKLLEKVSNLCQIRKISSTWKREYISVCVYTHIKAPQTESSCCKILLFV